MTTEPKKYKTIRTLTLNVKQVDQCFPIGDFVHMCLAIGIAFKQGRTRPDSQFYPHKTMTLEFFTKRHVEEFKTGITGTPIARMTGVSKL